MSPTLTLMNMSHTQTPLEGGPVLTRDGDHKEAPAPTGDLAIVFTDIEESTVMWETLPEAMRQSLRIHDELIRTTVRVHGGYEVKIIGDAFMLAFPTASSALSWSLNIQSKLVDADWPQEILRSPHAKEIRDANGKICFRGPRVQMSLHFGTPISQLNPITGRMEYIGPMVHRAARPINIAEGGQIVVTSDFLFEVRKSLAKAAVTRKAEGVDSTLVLTVPQSPSRPGFEVRDLGEHEFKGLSNALHLFLIVPDPVQGRLEYQSSIRSQPTSRL